MQCSPLPGGLAGHGIGANFHLESDVAAADGLDLLGNGVTNNLGCTYKKGIQNYVMKSERVE